MLFISHRGNLDGLNPERENTKGYVQEAIDKGFQVEIDIRVEDGSLFLGHDSPDCEIDLNWLCERSSSLWVHCKDFDSLSMLADKDLRIFFHEKERYSIISNKLIWAHDLSNVDSKCIIPLLTEDQVMTWNPKPVFGICSDFVSICLEKFGE